MVHGLTGFGSVCGNRLPTEALNLLEIARADGLWNPMLIKVLHQLDKAWLRLLVLHCSALDFPDALLCGFLLSRRQ